MEKKHFNKLAIASAILGIISIILWISIIYFPRWLQDLGIPQTIYFQVLEFILFIALISGDISLIMIARSKGEKRGLLFAIIGIIPIPLFLLGVFILLISNIL